MKKPFQVEISARHIHLCKEDLLTLCGPHVQLEQVKPLSQPGQFMSQVRLTLVGPKSSIERVVVLGPVRQASQVEVTATEARLLGVTPPVRESGDIKGSAPLTLVGPLGTVQLTEGCIIAKRHIHMTPADAEYYGVQDKQVVAVATGDQDRRLIFQDVVIRVRDDFALAMHIDTDEANAAGLKQTTDGVLLTDLTI